MKYMDEKRTTGASEQPTAAAGGGCFDGSICLDSAVEPVVTLCGHLYCWPCIYEWLCPDADVDSSRSSARRQRPVCKAAVSPDSLVLLYGRGGGSSSKKRRRGLASIPCQPAVQQNTRPVQRPLPSTVW